MADFPKTRFEMERAKYKNLGPRKCRDCQQLCELWKTTNGVELLLNRAVSDEWHEKTVVHRDTCTKTPPAAPSQPATREKLEVQRQREFDAFARKNDPLIVEGVIAPGDVDERDVRDVKPVELRGYAQCHFFAGIGVWSYALRLAGWPDDRPVWTGSCPCQPFSSAGKGAGFDDERHLWPYELEVAA